VASRSNVSRRIRQRLWVKGALTIANRHFRTNLERKFPGFHTSGSSTSESELLHRSGAINSNHRQANDGLQVKTRQW